MKPSNSPQTATKTPSPNKLPLDKGGRGDSFGTRQNYLAQIHIAKKWATETMTGFSEENYREMLYPLMDSQGISDEIYPTAAVLDDEHLAKLLNCFKKLGWVGHWKKPQKVTKYTVPQAQGMITQAQANYIHALQRKLKWDDARLNSFVNRQAKKQTTISMLTSKEASTVIHGLTKTLQTNEN